MAKIYGTLVEDPFKDSLDAPQELPSPSQESQQSFKQYGTPVTQWKEEPSIFEEAGRNTARTASRVIESIAGLPGDILRTAQMGAGALEKGAGKVREKIGLKPLPSGIKKPTLPGSQELKEISTRIFGEKVTAQSPAESFIDDIVSDAATLLIPVKGKVPFMRSIGTALAGNLASKGAEQLGAGQTGQTAAKLGAFFLSGLAAKGNVKKYWNQQYELADKSIPKGARIPTFKMEQKLNALESGIKKGLDTPSKSFVLSPLKNMKKKIYSGDVKIEDLVQYKKDLNEIRGKLYKDLSGKQSINYAQGKINDLTSIVDDELRLYGKKNPAFMEHYKNANEAYAGFQQSKRVGNWISKAIPFGKLGKGSLLILETVFKPATLKATIPAIGALKGGELITRMLKNPTLRRFYGNLMKDAVNENRNGFLKNLRKLEKEAEKTDPEIFRSFRNEDDSANGSD